MWNTRCKAEFTALLKMWASRIAVLHHCSISRVSCRTIDSTSFFEISLCQHWERGCVCPVSYCGLWRSSTIVVCFALAGLYLYTTCSLRKRHILQCKTWYTPTKIELLNPRLPDYCPSARYKYWFSWIQLVITYEIVNLIFKYSVSRSAEHGRGY